MRRLAVLAATVLLAACGQAGATPEAEVSTGPGTVPSADASTPVAGAPVDAGKVNVFAAASLNKVFPDISGDMDVSYSFDGSSGLVDQIKGGAPADVFASADRKNMDKAAEAGLLDGEPKQFATNYLVVVTPAGNPAGVTGFDASLDGKKLVVCAAEVPCGAATGRLAEAEGLTLTPVSEESSVTDVLGKVTSGEADAGLVYATDAKQAGDKVDTLGIPGATADPNTYWIAVVKDAPNPAGAKAFVETITGAEGLQKLAAFGFGAPQ